MSHFNFSSFDESLRITFFECKILKARAETGHKRINPQAVGFRNCLVPRLIFYVRNYDFRKKSKFEYEPNCHLSSRLKDRL